MRRALLFVLLSLAAAARAALPASDAFGYTASSIPFGWTDISGTGTPILSTDWTPNADDGAVQVDLPFNFRFYGSTYAKVYLSSNGYIQFGSSSAFYAPNCLDLNVAPLSIAAAYWMDLDPSKPGAAVYKEVLGLAPNRSMVLQFTAVPPRLGTGSVTFQIVIDEDNGLRFFYISTSTHDSGASAVAGLRAAFDCPNRQSLPVSCQQAVLTDSTAIHFSYPPVEPGCGTPTITSTPSISPTISQSYTRSSTPTITETFSQTSTFTPSSTLTQTPSITPTYTVTDSYTASFTETQSSTASPTFSETASVTPTLSVTPSFSSSPTETLSFSASPTFTETGSDTDTPSVTESFSASPTDTETPSNTPTASETPSATATASFTATPSSSATATPTASPSSTLTPSDTPSSTQTPSSTCTDTLTASTTSTMTPTSSVTPTLTASASSTPTPTFTCTLLPAASKPACLVVGQGSFTANASGPQGPTTMNAPAAVALDTRVTPYRLYVADTLNNRVLYWNNASTVTFGSTPDGVLGQGDLNSFSANSGGVSAKSLNAPAGLAVDPITGALWVADTGNHRVLRFSLPLAVTGTAADRVLGQGGNFSSNTVDLGGISASSLASPRGLSTDPFGDLAIADAGNHRVLRISSPGVNSSADAVWGQGGSFSSGVANLGGFSAQSLNTPSGVLLLADKLWIADSGDHRVLQFDLSLPLSQSYSILLGQPNAAAHSANRGFGLTNDDRFNTPTGLAVDYSGRLYVGDLGNNRVIGFEPPYSGQAQLVFGQPNVGLNGVGCGDDLMNAPAGIAASGATLAVADSGNDRVMAYGCSAGLQASTSTPTYTPTTTATPTCTVSATLSSSPTITASYSPSPSFSMSPTISRTFSRTITLTLTFSNTVTPTFSISPTFSPTPTASITGTTAPTWTPIPSATPYPSTGDAVIPYPNPISPDDSRACFAFPAATSAALQVYDFLGQPVSRLDNSQIQAPAGLACWDLRASDGSRVAPGVYFVRVISDGQARLAKFTVR